MSSELERRLEAMLAAAPEPDPGAGEEALHRALRAYIRSRRRGEGSVPPSSPLPRSWSCS